MKLPLVVSLCLLGSTVFLRAQTASPLFERGYAVLPTPQKAEVGQKDIEITHAWRIDVDKTAQGDIAPRELNALLEERHRFKFTDSQQSVGPTGRLTIAPDSVQVKGVNNAD